MRCVWIHGDHSTDVQRTYEETGQQPRKLITYHYDRIHPRSDLRAPGKLRYMCYGRAWHPSHNAKLELSMITAERDGGEM
jgi:hypothetical protein